MSLIPFAWLKSLADVQLLELSYYIKHFPYSNRLPIIWTCHTITFRKSTPSEYTHLSDAVTRKQRPRSLCFTKPCTPQILFLVEKSVLLLLTCTVRRRLIKSWLITIRSKRNLHFVLIAQQKQRKSGACCYAICQCYIPVCVFWPSFFLKVA